MDIEILLWLQGLRTPALNALNMGIAFLSNESVLLVLICAAYWCLAKREALYLIFSFFAGFVVNSVLKISFCVPRPWLRDVRVQPYAPAIESATGYSFPSGHTACATAVFGGIALVQWPRRRWLSWLLIALTALVGFSRMYVGVHTPQDVLVSLVVGAALLFAVRAGMRAVERKPQRDTWVMAAGLAIAVGLALYARFKPYPADVEPDLLQDAFKIAGALAGAVLGWFLERRFVRFDVRASLPVRAIRLAGGLAGLLLVKAVLKGPLEALLGAGAGSAARYFLMTLWSIYLWPLLFSIRGAKK